MKGGGYVRWGLWSKGGVMNPGGFCQGGLCPRHRIFYMLACMHACYFFQMRFSHSFRLGHTHGWPSAKHNLYFVFGTMGWFWKEPFGIVLTVNSKQGTICVRSGDRSCSWLMGVITARHLPSCYIANLRGAKWISPFLWKGQHHTLSWLASVSSHMKNVNSCNRTSSAVLYSQTSFRVLQSLLHIHL